MTRSAMQAATAGALFALAAPLPARAEAVDPFKLTVGAYRDSGHGDAVDTNLRYTSDLGNAWVGYYRGIDEGVSQWRAGWDRTFGETVRVLPSLQFASGGFVGGSVQAETGDPWFAAVGLGRTNLRPYVNLNFDPNDSYLLAAGRRDASGQVLMVQMVRDNREHPDQRHFHFSYRQPLEGKHRLTLDALYKQGLVEGGMIHRWGATATYDWPRFFARIAFDPKVNFTPVDMWRFSIGTRF